MIRRARGTRAFTLVEILVGMAISTLILTAAAGIFVTGLHSWRQGSDAYRLMQAGQSIGDLIERNLRSAVSPADASGNVSIYFWGEDLSDDDVYGHRITFMSTAAMRFPRSSGPTDMSEIDFEFDPESGEGMTMRIDSTPDEFPDDGGYTAELSSMVKSFEVKYFDGIEWSEDWFDSVLPQAIEFHVMLSDAKEDDSAPAPKAERTGGSSGASSNGPAKTGPSSGRVYEVSRLISMPTAKRERTGIELGGEAPSSDSSSSDSSSNSSSSASSSSGSSSSSSSTGGKR